MVIIYLHGFRSTAYCDKANITKELFPEYQVKSLSYSPHDPHHAVKQIKSFAKKLGSLESVLVIGSSLGGFWARWMSYQFGFQSLLINPSLHPDKTLNIVGEYEIFDGSGNTIEVTQERIDAFKNFKVNAETATKLNCTVWIALDDEVIDAKSTFEEVESLHKSIMFETGGHRFSQYIEMKKSIEKLI